MTYEEFLDKVKTVLGYTDNDDSDRWYGGPYGWKKIAKNGHVLTCRWIIGGASGGSCWGDSPEPRSGDPEPEFEELDKVLESLAPTISFIKYKRLLRDHIFTDEESEREYYGNYTVYAVKSIKLENLYNFLVEEQLLAQ